MAIPLPSQTELQSKLDYDPKTGQLTWAYSDRGIRKGKIAGCVNKRKSRRIDLMLEGRTYMAHRLIWKWVTGDDPPQQIDHVNHNPQDNRWSNLRLASPQQNATNRRGYGKYKKGVIRTNNGLTFGAQITVKGKNHYLGTFATEVEAHQAYCDTAKRIHQEFACVTSNPKSTETT